MREYKFRGKRLDNGEWVYGDLLTEYIHHKGLTIVEAGCIYHEVDPATVGQITGLCDMKAQEIYEGDILYHTEDCLGKAVWDKEAACWDLMFPTEDGGFVLERLCDHADISIIVGNIYDDPQLTERMWSNAQQPPMSISKLLPGLF